MSTTANALYLPVGGKLVPLDLSEDVALLPTFQANDRTKPESIQSDYSPEFSVPGTAHNHRLLRHAAASQPAKGSAYVRLPCVLTSGGVEVLPLGLLYVNGYSEGKYQLQVAGGNRRLVEALGDKMLSDLDLSRFDHYWTPENIAERLPYAYWAANGYGYEVYERGQPVDFAQLDPYTLYPSCSENLIWQQILTDAGFTGDDLSSEPLVAALNVPSANPFTYNQDYREARRLQAGLSYVPLQDYTTNDFAELHSVGIAHLGGFGLEVLPFDFVRRKPYHAPDAGTASYSAGRYVVDTMGYYDLSASVTLRFGCEGAPNPGRVRCKLIILVNGQQTYDATGNPGSDELEVGEYTTHTFTPKLNKMLLKPGDYVELWWKGDEINTGIYSPTRPFWEIGPYGSQVTLASGPIIYPGGVVADGPTLSLAAEVQFSAELLPDFPPSGLVKLNQWLPDMKQLDFVKSRMLLLGLTLQCDQYEPHLRLSPGNKLLANIPRALDWTRKRDSFAQPGRLPERNLGFRFGSYGQLNSLKWLEDEHVTEGYGDGSIAVADEVLPATYDLATLPFAASEPSPEKPGLLRILNFDKDLTATDYTKVEAKPRLTLRRADGDFDVQLVMIPAIDSAPATLQTVSTTASYFAGVDVSLLLDGTVLTEYYGDLRAMLDESRHLVERYRLTPQDVAELDYSVPIWDALLGDYFAVIQVSEYDARRAVEVTLCRLNAAHLGAPKVPGDGVEFADGDFYNAEFY